MKKIVFCLSLLLTAVASNAFAGESEINHSLSKIGIKAESITPSPIRDMSAVLTENGMFYLSNDGKYLLKGSLYDLSGEIPHNVSNQILIKKLAAFKDQMITYQAPKEKYVVTVFTDISCGYCHKLHENMQEYNKLGITVRYLAFPRHGVHSQSGKDMQSVWCSATPNKLLDAAFKGDTISPIKSCKIDIENHVRLGLQFGVQGTPAIIMNDGSMLPGYLPPEDLLAMLQKHAK